MKVYALIFYFLNLMTQHFFYGFYSLLCFHAPKTISLLLKQNHFDHGVSYLQHCRAVAITRFAEHFLISITTEQR
jgi:hypothetical protein